MSLPVIGILIYIFILSFAKPDDISRIKNEDDKKENHRLNSDKHSKNTPHINLQTQESRHEIAASPENTQQSVINVTNPSLQKKLGFVSDAPTEILCTLIRNQGNAFNNNPTGFMGLLKDYYKGEYKREVKILTTSIEENIPQDILAKKDKIPFSVLSSQFIQRLEGCGFSKELSIWAVEAWEKALKMDQH